jgi:hypothetical protein
VTPIGGGGGGITAEQVIETHPGPLPVDSSGYDEGVIVVLPDGSASRATSGGWLPLAGGINSALGYQMARLGIGTTAPSGVNFVHVKNPTADTSARIQIDAAGAAHPALPSAFTATELYFARAGDVKWNISNVANATTQDYLDIGLVRPNATGTTWPATMAGFASTPPYDNTAPYDGTFTWPYAWPVIRITNDNQINPYSPVRSQYIGGHPTFGQTAMDLALSYFDANWSLIAPSSIAGVTQANNPSLTRRMHIGVGGVRHSTSGLRRNPWTSLSGTITVTGTSVVPSLGVSSFATGDKIRVLNPAWDRATQPITKRFLDRFITSVGVSTFTIDRSLPGVTGAVDYGHNPDGIEIGANSGTRGDTFFNLYSSQHTHNGVGSVNNYVGIMMGLPYRNSDIIGVAGVTGAGSVIQVTCPNHGMPNNTSVKMGGISGITNNGVSLNGVTFSTVFVDDDHFNLAGTQASGTWIPPTSPVPSAAAYFIPDLDYYAEPFGVTFSTHGARRGQLVSCAEFGIYNYSHAQATASLADYAAGPAAGSGGANRAGPSNVAGASIVCSEYVPYAEYASDGTFDTSHPYYNSGMRGLSVAVNQQRIGTGIYLGSSVNGFVRALVLNGRDPSGLGVDVFCVDGAGRMGLGPGVTVNQANPTGFTNAIETAGSHGQVHFRDGITTRTLSAGTPSVTAPNGTSYQDGTILVDNSGTGRLVVRVNGAWRAVALNLAG